MKLVIDVSENYYNDLMSLKLNDGEHLSYEMEMIRNGIPLPKGHGRLIDADALFEEYEKTGWFYNSDRDKVAEKILLDAPTIIEADTEE